jgi:hypothetical protein
MNDEQLVKIERLGQLKASGFLTDESFYSRNKLY